jgi:hypothetical protein
VFACWPFFAFEDHSMLAEVREAAVCSFGAVKVDRICRDQQSAKQICY